MTRDERMEARARELGQVLLDAIEDPESSTQGIIDHFVDAIHEALSTAYRDGVRAGQERMRERAAQFESGVDPLAKRGAMILVVNLDLVGPAASYDKLYDELKKLGTWWHYMRWTWILDTAIAPEDVVATLRPHVQSSDRMLVCPLSIPYQGLLTPTEWEWINSRMLQQQTLK